MATSNADRDAVHQDGQDLVNGISSTLKLPRSMITWNLFILRLGHFVTTFFANEIKCHELLHKRTNEVRKASNQALSFSEEKLARLSASKYHETWVEF